MNQVELLAPAKDLSCGIAAIDCGADAVYIGAPRFGARESAGNAVDDIAALARYAHKYRARVYAVVNTLLRDEEIPLARQLIWDLYDIGVDGVIIQDVGLLECDLPPLPLIASTQMHNATPQKAAFLEAVGFHRIILARELSLDQIKEIRQAAPNIELEFFIHGALCVGYSGQCYLSYALGGRSGNRGQCAQPCRKPYTLVDGRGAAIESGRHLLSLRDLNLSGSLRELLQAGVRSFKIEGRMKDETYVANIVSYYRLLLDEILPQMGLRKSSSGKSRIEFIPNPDKTFHRGYTSYFLHGPQPSIGSLDTPKMIGEPIGKVISMKNGGLVIDGNISLHPGDGICYFDSQHRLCGDGVNAVQGRRAVLNKGNGIAVGTMIFRNHDHEFLIRVKESRKDRRIAAALSLRDATEGLWLSAKDEDGVAAESFLPGQFEDAKNPEKALGDIRRQLEKSGDTEFECKLIAMQLNHIVFLPISLLNRLRREALANLAAARLAARSKVTGGVQPNSVPYPETELTFQGNVLNRHAEKFYRRHGVKRIESAAESGLDLRGRRIMTTRYCLKRELGLCSDKKKEPMAAEPVALIDDQGRKLFLHFNCKECEMEIFLGE